MTEPHHAPDPPETGGSAPAEPGSVTGVLTACAIALAVMLLAALGSRHEILHAWGLSGEGGTYVVGSCTVTDDDEKSLCTGEFTPDGGGEPVPADFRGEPDAGDRFAASLREDGAQIYRATLGGRLASIAVPALPMAFLAFAPFLVYATRTRGRVSRVGFVVLGVVPAAFFLVVAVSGWVASL